MGVAMSLRTFIPLGTLLLAACSHSAPQPGQQGRNGVVHMTLPSGPTVAEVAPQQPDGGQWSAQNGGLAFGVPGQAPLLTLAHLETIGAIKGGNTITATLPGGGALKLPPNAETGRLLDACRASDKKTAAPETSAN
jgi:hypothetical protein